MRIHDLPTPALIVEAGAFDHNLVTMASIHPGEALRPHVKAHKCTALAAAQAAVGHRHFTCATPREVLGMAAAGLHHVLIDVNVGLPRCGCESTDAGRLADLARHLGLTVRGVMGYEGHLMVVADREQQRVQVAAAMDKLLAAHADVGGDIVSAGGTGTYDLHDRITELQAGSYALMDTHYAQLGLPFRQAGFVVGTVVSANARHAVADVGLKALGMDHGNPTVADLDGRAATVWFCSDEHVTFGALVGVGVDDRVLVTPAHIDPTMAMHESAWLVRDGEVIDRWPIDLRCW